MNNPFDTLFTDKELVNLKNALDHSSIVAITDKKGTIIYVNDAFCKISKYSRDELLGKNHRILKSGHHHAKEVHLKLWSTFGNKILESDDLILKYDDFFPIVHL